MAVEAFLGDGCNTSIRGGGSGHGGQAVMVGGEGAPWPPAMELVVAQSLPGRRRRGGDARP